MAKRNASARSLVVVSDLHCGCQMGLCPPDGIALDEGGRYTPNRTQIAMWAWWREFWDEFVPAVTRGESYDVLLNGDALDGEHHGVKTLISNNKAVQQKIAREILSPIRSGCRRLYAVRGTGAHDGESAEDVENLYRWLDAVPDREGRYSRWRLRYRVAGPHACLVDALHHIGGTGGSHYDTSAPKRELIEAFVQAARHGTEAPMFVIRSHRHRYTPVEEPTIAGRSRCIVTPGWQGKTPLAYRIAGARQAEPQFGGIVIRNGDEEAYFRAYWRQPEPPETEEG